MIRFVLITLLSAISFSAHTQTEQLQCYTPDPEARIRERNVDFITLDLTLDFVPEDGKVSGIAKYTFSPIQFSVDSVFLDAPGILVEFVMLDDVKTKFRIDSAGTTVFFNPPLKRETKHALTIKYEAYPKKGIYFNGWNNKTTDSETDPNIIRKQIWTQGQGTDNRFWIPSYDGLNDKLITIITINFRPGYTLISNGEASPFVQNIDGTVSQTFVMPHPHPVYLIMLAVGKYDHINYTSKNGIVTKQYYYPGTKKIAELTYEYSAEIMDFMEEETGVRYPWTTYANVPVQEFLYGAMENTTATIFSDFFYQDERTFPDKNYVDINTHELAHQWFGDYVTAWSGSSHWLQESFATYYAKKMRQRISGDDMYHWKRREEMLTAFSADLKDDIPVGHSKAGSQRVYQKGSIVLDMLRYYTGDEEFKLVIKRFLENYPYTNVESRDLELEFMRTLGINVEWFFDQWIYRGGFPEYTVKYSSDKSNIKIQIDQTHEQRETIQLFKMPIHVQVHYKDGSFDDKLVWVENASTNILFNHQEGKEIAFVLFDPNSMVYAKVNFQKNYEELKFQAFNAPNMLDRYDAIQQMRETDINIKRDDLIRLYEKEKFYSIKAEIIAQLSFDDKKESITILSKGLNDADALVRRAALINLKTIPSKLQDDYEARLNDFNYTNCEIALFKLCDLHPDKKEKYLEKTKDLQGSNKNIRITWLELANDAEYMPELVRFSSSDYEFRTRNNAISSLVDLNYCDAEVVRNLFDAAISTNHRLATPARNALKKFQETPAFATLINQYYQSNMWSPWEQSRLKSLFI